MCGFIILDRSCRLSQSATSDSRPQPCPRGTLIADQRRACAARPKGKNEESPGSSLLRTERFKFFPATGAHISATPSFIQAAFTSQPGSLFLSLYAPRYCLTARVSGGNLQNCAPSAACGGAMTQERNVSPPVPLVLYAMLTLSLPPPST